MEFSLEAIAKMVNGDIVGEPGKIVCGAAPFDSATPDDITFAGQAKFLKKLPECTAGAVLVPRQAAPQSMPIIRVDDAQVAFAQVMQAFYPHYVFPPVFIRLL
jgi:UDP-3-O-[3-hydroxymyristoyl] glucosamine N-acyltransferase